VAVVQVRSCSDTLHTGAVEVNALAQGALQRFAQWPWIDTRPNQNNKPQTFVHIKAERHCFIKNMFFNHKVMPKLCCPLSKFVRLFLSMTAIIRTALTKSAISGKAYELRIFKNLYMFRNHNFLSENSSTSRLHDDACYKYCNVVIFLRCRTHTISNMILILG